MALWVDTDNAFPAFTQFYFARFKYLYFRCFKRKVRNVRQRKVSLRCFLLCVIFAVLWVLWV